MTTPANLTLGSYHVTMADGSERDIKGTSDRVDTSGALVITTTTDGDAVIYAPGTWKYCEPERKDDRG